MKPATKSLLKGFLIALTAVALVSFAGYAIHAKADGPSKADYQNLAAIKANQKVLAKDRDAYNAFLAAKSDNQTRTAAINADGWNIDWSTMTLIPNSPSFQ